MPRTRRAVSLVERGWQAARDCSLQLEGRDVTITHVMKGMVPRDVLALVEPRPWIRVAPVSRLAFRPLMWVIVLVGGITRQVRWVLCDNERTWRELRPWCRRLGVACVEVHLEPLPFTLRIDDQARGLAEVFGRPAAGGA
jgi:hypothetical protein